MPTPEHSHKVQLLVDGALDRPSAARTAFLDEACGSDATLRSEVARRLDECERAAGVGGLFTTPAVAVASGLRSALSDRYTVERELGRGGMAIVYLARDLRHDRNVAVKVLEPHVAPAGAERFMREIHIAARLTHPHVLSVYDSGEADSRLYYVMPYVDGETLRARLVRDASLSINEAVRLLRELADALAYAHGHGVVHRDLKPENVLLSGGHAVVADFGIAKAIAAATETGNASRATLTGTGVALGTPGYMAPEQAVGDTTMNHRVDLYALGIIAYEMLTGSHPFAGRTAQALVAAHLTETPAPIAERRANVPPLLAALVTRLIEKDPHARPQSANEVLQVLDGVATGSVAIPAATERRTRSALLAAVALLVLIASVVAFWQTHQWTGRAVGPTAIHTVAVLPFANTSGSSDDDYFSDGLTDELAHALSRIPGLRIAGRTSSYAFKGKSAAAQEIGRVLGVEAFISGTVRRSGQRLRVTTQLVNAADGTVVSDSVYERQATDVFAVQDELTRAIVAALAPALDGRGESPRVADVKRGTADEQAYDFYLQGRHYFVARGKENLALAARSFRQAIARDSGFARAYAGLSMTYGVLPNYVPDPADTLMPLAKASAERAVALDPTLGEAHGALGQALDAELRIRDALAEQRKFVALDSTNVTAHQWLGATYLNLGHNEEAIAELERAKEIDHLAPSVTSLYVTALWTARRFPEALAAGRRQRALDSTFHYGILSLGQAQIFAGQADSAVATFERGMRFHGDDSRIVSGLMLAEAAAGRWADADRIRQQLKRPGGDQFDGTQAAFGDLVFGNSEPLIRILTSDAGLKRFMTFGGLLGCAPYFDPLWSDTRFRAK
ncbi:MAG: protein kinase, partial [Gemmatimonadaceae bacterium]